MKSYVILQHTTLRIKNTLLQYVKIRGKLTPEQTSLLCSILSYKTDWFEDTSEEDMSWYMWHENLGVVMSDNPTLRC